MRRLLSIAFVCAAAAALWPAAAAPAAVRLTPIGRLPFPERGYVVDLPGRSVVTPASVHVRENGQVVRNVDVAPLSAAGLHFGVVLAMDASESMAGEPLKGAVAARKAFLARRAQDQEVGIVTFNGDVAVAQRPTKQASRLQAAVASPPRLAYGTRMYDAIDESLRLLAQARLSSGSIVVLSDGADVGSKEAIDEVVTKAKSRHVRIFTVGLRSGAFDARTLRSLAERTGGEYVEASTPERLAPIFAALSERLSSEYVVRYRSDAAPRSHVDVAMAVDDVGTLKTEYVAPTPAGLAPYHRSLVKRFIGWGGTPFLLALLIAAMAALAVVAFLKPRRSTLVERVTEFAGSAKRTAVDEGRAVRTAAVRSRPVQGLMGRIERDREIARIEMSSSRIVALTVGGTVLAVIVLGIISPIFALLGLLTPLITRSMMANRLKKVRDEFADQLAPNLQVLASALRIGHSFVGALGVVVDNAREPSQSELRRAVSDERLGVPIDEAISRVAERMDSRDLQQVALLAELQRTAGGNAAEVLDTVVETLRERGDLRRLVRTLTAQGRMARWILSSLPIAAGVLLSVLQPTAVVPMFQSGAGQVALLVAALMIVTGSLIIQKIIDIKV